MTAQIEPADVSSDGGSFSGAPIGTTEMDNADVPVIVSDELAQPFGVNAIGTTICREFGVDGVFYGVISAFHTRKGQDDLYTVEYNDGDVEDLDLEEYNYAYALWLKEEGWQVDECHANAVNTTGKSSPRKQKKTKKSTKDVPQPKGKWKATAAPLKIAKLQEVVDLTAKTTIAGKHISAMDAEGKTAVVSMLSKTAKKNENKVVKDAVVAVAYGDACRKAFIEHLQCGHKELSAMVHARRLTIVEEQGILSTVKVGDWIEAESDYSKDIISDGGIGCVFGLHEEMYGVEGQLRTIAVDVHSIVDNRKERGVLLKRCVVIPMPFKSAKVQLRTRKAPAIVPRVLPPEKSPVE